MAHRTAASPKEAVEDGVEHDSGMPASKKLQGERGGGAALKENVCQVDSACPPVFSLLACALKEALSVSLYNRVITVRINVFWMISVESLQ